MDVFHGVSGTLPLQLLLSLRLQTPMGKPSGSQTLMSPYWKLSHRDDLTDSFTLKHTWLWGFPVLLLFMKINMKTELISACRMLRMGSRGKGKYFGGWTCISVPSRHGPRWWAKWPWPAVVLANLSFIYIYGPPVHAHVSCLPSYFCGSILCTSLKPTLPPCPIFFLLHRQRVCGCTTSVLSCIIDLLSY